MVQKEICRQASIIDVFVRVRIEKLSGTSGHAAGWHTERRVFRV